MTHKMGKRVTNEKHSISAYPYDWQLLADEGIPRSAFFRFCTRNKKIRDYFKKKYLEKETEIKEW